MSNMRFDFITENPDTSLYHLLYVATSCYDKDWNSLMHTHQCAELFFCVHGSGHFHTADQTFAVKSNDLVIINANVEHAESSVHSDPLEYLVLGVEGLNFQFGHSGNDSRYCVLNFDRDKKEIMFYLQNILREVNTQTEGYGDICQHILEILLVHVQRLVDVKICSDTPETEKIHASNRNCALIRQYIDEHFSEPITLDLLAQMVHINKCHLVRTFQKEYGTTPINYLIETRLKESRFMLENTNYSTSQIVALSGFSSPSYFSQCFRRKENMTPSQYRELHAHRADALTENEPVSDSLH